MKEILITFALDILGDKETREKLYAALPKGKLGYASDEMPDPDHMDAYYLWGRG